MNDLRKRVPRSTFARWKPSSERRPLDIVAADEIGRDPALLPMRRERMRENAFAFYRGTAAIMAADLATVPVTGLRAQICGDAHVLNFGGYATPERNLIFDVNDFDETLEGPWEWDLARLCASLPLLAHARGFAKETGDEAVFTAAESYRRSMRELAAISPLDVWYSRVDVRGALKRELSAPRDAEGVKFTGEADALGTRAFDHYKRTLLPGLHALLDRYAFHGVYEHPVGVGSVGLFAGIVELETERGERLYLQVKQARASVLEPYLRKSPFANHGERVIAGQRAMQAATDAFVGWTTDGDRDFYVRQLRDRKASLDVERLRPKSFCDYARRCGGVLARAHARTGDPVAIAAYLGTNQAFDEAMVRFARTYATLTEADYDAFSRHAA